jgi:hypothetical protein
VKTHNTVFHFSQYPTKEKQMIAILPIVKGAAGIATSVGAGAVVGNAIKATTPANLKPVSKVLIGIGGIALSSIAGDLAATYIENQIQGIADSARVIKETAKKVGHATDAAVDTFQEEVKEDPTTPNN